MSGKRDIYLQRILEEFEVAEYRSIVTHKHYTKMSYKELYYDIKERYELLETAQDVFLEVRPCEMMKLPFFKGKHPTSAYSIIQTIFGLRDSLPRKTSSDNLKTILKQWKEHNEGMQ